MNIDLTEEEREFLYRVCDRAKTFSNMGLKSFCIPKNDTDLIKINILLEKLKR